MEISKGVPPKREVHQHEGIDPCHESYVYFGVPVGNDVLINFSFGVPPSDAI